MREPIHPGETLREDLDALGMSAAALARRIEVPVNRRIAQILNGRRAVTGDTALRLGRFFGTSGGVLAQPPEALRAAACGARERRGDRPATHPGRRQGPARGGLTGCSRLAERHVDSESPPHRQRRNWCARLVQSRSRTGAW